jgi:hypothetical protein
MATKTRLGLYLEDEEMKKQIKIAAAKKGLSTTAYCEEAIKEKLKREGKLSDQEIERRKAVLARIDERRRKIGSVGASVSELVNEGRRR